MSEFLFYNASLVVQLKQESSTDNFPSLNYGPVQAPYAFWFVMIVNLKYDIWNKETFYLK